LKPDPKIDDLEILLVESARLGHVDAVRYLLELGAKPNAKENGGSGALDNSFGVSDTENSEIGTTSWILTDGPKRRNMTSPIA
jgi:hypothetical protein